MSDTSKKVLFLDRDGPINLTGPKCFVSDPKFFYFTEGIKDICKEAQEKGYRIAVITNQTGIGENLYTLADMMRVHAYMLDEFNRDNIKIDDILYVTKKNDPYRKPNPGMFHQIKERWDLSDEDMHNSIAIGDRAKDAQAALLAGVGNVLWYLPSQCLNNNYKPITQTLSNPAKDLEQIKKTIQKLFILSHLSDSQTISVQARVTKSPFPVQHLSFFTHMKQIEGYL